MEDLKAMPTIIQRGLKWICSMNKNRQIGKKGANRQGLQMKTRQVQVQAELS
jgi:hypothetical protein